MTNKSGKEIYREQVQELINTIKRINEDDSKSKVKKSNDIMKCLRNESILVPAEYINSFFYTRDRLIDLFYFLNRKKSMSEKRLTKLAEEFLGNFKFPKLATLDPDVIKDSTYDGESETIRGNSFGPFNPEKYCKQDLKILWLLKEPLIKSRTSWLKGDRGGHNQALYNQTWEKMEENPTVENLIKITREILQIVNERKYTEQEAMDHICIIEVSHFPGLAFQSSNSDDKNIGKWAKLNKDLIQELIAFYDPNVIIGAQSFMGYFTSNLNLLNWFSDSNNNENSVYEDGCPNIIFENIIKKTWGGTDKHSMVRTEDGRYWINAYHPSVYGKNLNILNTNITKFAEELKIDKNPKQENIISANLPGELSRKTCLAMNEMAEGFAGMEEIG